MTMFYVCLPCRIDDHGLCAETHCDCCAGTGVARSAPTSPLGRGADRGAERGATGEHGGSSAGGGRGRAHNPPADALPPQAGLDKHGQPRPGVESFASARRDLFAHHEHEGTTE